MRVEWLDKGKFEVLGYWFGWWLHGWKRICLQCRRPQFDSWVGKIPWRRDRLSTPVFFGFPGGSDSEESICNEQDLGSILGWEDPLEEGMATHSSILAWRIPWTEEPGRLHSMGSQRVGHNWATKHTHNYIKFNSVSLQEDSLTWLLCVLCAGWCGGVLIYSMTFPSFSPGHLQGGQRSPWGSHHLKI